MDLIQLTRCGFGALAVTTTLLPSYARGNATNEENTINREPDVSARTTEELNLPPDKSIGFYVGSDLTDDGSTLLGGFGHEPSSHWIEIVPRQQHPKDATIPGE